MFKNIYPFALFCIVALSSEHALGEECRPIEKSDEVSDRTAYVRTTGVHCLTYGLVQPKVFDIHAGSYKKLSTSLLEIEYSGEYWDSSIHKIVRNPPFVEGSSFEVDLQNHLLKNEGENASGVRALGGIRHVKIRNGKVNVSGLRSSKGVTLENGDGKLMYPNINGYGNKVYVGNADYEDVAASETLDKKAPTYEPTDNLVDHMTIKAGWRGVVMGGANNILRDSTIEVDGHTAIFMYGPGSIIENNTIIIHGQGDAKPFDAAIKLRDAHGAIVRNNHIIYKGSWFGKAPVAINLLDSTDVKIEGNTLEKFEKLVRLNGESTFSETVNSLK